VLLAEQLKGRAQVTIFEKARGVSGRLSTRYAAPYQFDHGAQFFSAKTQSFQAFLEPLIAQNVLAHWDARLVELSRPDIDSQLGDIKHCTYYVGVPKMNQFIKHLSKNLDIRLRTCIARVEKEGDRWNLQDDVQQSQGTFDWVISTAPPKQSAVLLPHSFEHYGVLGKVQMLGCFALMLGFTEPLLLPWDAALVRNADIRWIAVDSSKPGRPKAYSMLVHSTNSWAERHLDDDYKDVQKHLCMELSKVIGMEVSHADYVGLHGWRFADIGKQRTAASFMDAQNNLAVCGDWCLEGHVEAAFTSAMHLAKKLKGHL